MKKSTKSKNNASKNRNNLEKMKYEIADELGVNLGGESTAKENGKVGGEMTRRFVEMGQGKKNQSKSSSSRSKKKNN